MFPRVYAAREKKVSEEGCAQEESVGVEGRGERGKEMRRFRG